MYVKAKVTPGAKREKVTRLHSHEFDILVREPAARNLANKRVREIIALQFEVPIGSVTIVTGHRSPSKIFDVAGL